MRICAYDKCKEPFEARTHNQRYHTDECCRRATNDRLMEQYYKRKARKQGHIRICQTVGCPTPLSRYNSEDICRKCVAEQEAAARQKILKMLVA